MKKCAFFLIIIMSLFSSVSLIAQEVTERFKQGTYIEAAALIRTGPHAGKVAVVDGWGIYLYDINTGAYEKLFSCTGIGLSLTPRGICAISQGEFAGNFLLDDQNNKNTLFMVNDAGELVTTVNAADFEWTAHCEAITEITGGPYQGKFAMLGFLTLTAPIAHHIFIFRIERDGGAVKAFLEKDIVYSQNFYGVAAGLCYLDETYPDPTLRNCFVTSRLGQKTLFVIDMSGAIKKTISGNCNVQVEGLGYLNSGLYQGNFLFADRWSEENCIRDLDGTVIVPIDLQVGLNLHQPRNIAWLEDRGQFLEASYYYNSSPPTFNGLYAITRLGAQNWRKDMQLSYTQILTILEVTAMTPRGTHFLLGYDRVNNQNVYRVHALDVNYSLVTSYTIPQQYVSVPLRSINYIPATDTASDCILIAATSTTVRQILFFDPTFSSAPQVVDVSSKISFIYGICYDAANERYYVSDGRNLKVFDTSWNEIAAFDLSSFFPRLAGNLTKVTSGDLKSNLAICNYDDNEIVFLNAEYAIAIKQIEKLIQSVEASGINSGIMNSLIQKLEGAIDAVEKKNIKTAINKVESFQNEVQAQSGKKIPADTASDWLEQATLVIKGLNNI
ncbi:MAG: hypothetical protein WCC06_10900 [Candidatus Aminicenantales bacterium]